MSMKLLAGALSSAIAIACAMPQQAAAAETPLALSLVRGGALSADAISNGNLVYLPTGRLIATWDYGKTAAPLRLATTAPADGVLTGLTRRDAHLYASWRGVDGTSGVATYSIADPARPVFVGNSTYPASGEQLAFGIAVANRHLYLFDSDHGVYVSDLANPAKPVFVATPITGASPQYNHVLGNGNRIYASGRTFTSQTVLDVFDATVPKAPVLAGESALDGFNTFTLSTDGARFLGVGYQFTTFDLDASSRLVARLQADMPDAAMAGAWIGNKAATFGLDGGLQVWDTIRPGSPRQVGSLKVSTLGARRSLTRGSLLLVPTETDLMQAFELPKTRDARHLSTSWIPGGVAASDAVLYKGKPLLLQANYGFTINDAQTLAPLTRYEADLPESLQERDFEQMAIVGDTAYLTAWGYGLITVDLSGAQPVELGRTPLVFASVIDVKGDYAYVAKWTNGGLLAAVDVSDPATPTPVYQIGLASQPYRLRIAGRYAYLAEGQEFGADDTGGLRIFDLVNPAEPVQVAHLEDGCGNAFDISIDAAVSLAYLACDGGMQVIDVANAAAPKVVGRFDAGVSGGYNKVAQRGDRAWYADVSGLHELDVSDPTHPVQTKLTSLGHQGNAQRLLPTDDGRLFALAGNAGVHVFSPTATVAGSKTVAPRVRSDKTALRAPAR